VFKNRADLKRIVQNCDFAWILVGFKYQKHEIILL